MIIRKHKPILKYWGQDWHSWFAWRPVETMRGDTVWLEYVLRQNVASSWYSEPIYRYEIVEEFSDYTCCWQDMHLSGQELIRKRYPEGTHPVEEWYLRSRGEKK